jgi:hypothetical protein
MNDLNKISVDDVTNFLKYIAFDYLKLNTRIKVDYYIDSEVNAHYFIRFDNLVFKLSQYYITDKCPTIKISLDNFLREDIIVESDEKKEIVLTEDSFSRIYRFYEMIKEASETEEISFVFFQKLTEVKGLLNKR